MKLIDVPPGAYVTRPWYKRSTRNMLRIHVPENETPVYLDDTTQSRSVVSRHSSAWGYSDFELCDFRGHPLTIQTKLKEPTMNFNNTQVIVTSSDNTVKCYATEAEAFEGIAAKLEEAPRTKFTMFKPYQAIEPKVPDLSDLIRKIE